MDEPDARSSTGQQNPYLALRQAKIARNEARLRELGLFRSSKSFKESSLPSVRRSARQADNNLIDSSTAVRQTRRCSTRKSAQQTSSTESEAPRRSARTRSNDTKAAKQILDPDVKPRKRQKVTILPTPATDGCVAPGKIFPPNSARSMAINVQKLISGGETNPGLLGKQMECNGKNFVMTESAKIAVDGFSGGSISFNKYSGVQEWGNSVLFLWVNLNAPNSEVVNDFLEEGRQVTWFGGSRMHPGTASIQKLLQVGSRNDLKDSPNHGVILWCRQYIPAEKTFSPYVCLGRLKVRTVQYN